MKKYLILTILFATFASTVSAQIRTSYFMEGSTFRTDMNPALAPTRGYLNFPVIGNTGLSINNNFASVSNFLYPNPDGEGLVTFLHPSVDKNDFLKRLHKSNQLGISSQFSLVGFGAHTKRFYWNAGINLKADANVMIPKEFFTLLTTLGQGYHELNSLTVDANAYLEAYVGAAIPIKNIATVGFRVKGLLGLASADLTADRLYANITDEIVDANMSSTLRISTIAARKVAPGENFELSSLAESLFNINNIGFKNYGAALDLGFEVRLIGERLRLSAAVTDLGFISWDGDRTVEGIAQAGFIYRGFNFDNMEIDTESDGFNMTTGSTQRYIKRLNYSINAGIEYAILRNHISFGLLAHTRFYRKSTTAEVTASVNFKPLNWLTATASHTFLNGNKLGVMGLALNIHPRGLNLFVGTDFVDFRHAKLRDSNVRIPINQSSANVYVGFGFSFKYAPYRKASNSNL